MADPLPHFAASAVSSFVTFPLWKVTTISQSGYTLKSTTAVGRFWEAVRPPWRGTLTVVGGMTWARTVIFFGSDYGSLFLQTQGCGAAVCSSLPPMLTSIFVQITNQPLVRSTAMLQDPQYRTASTARFPTCDVLLRLQETRGLRAWWRGTTASLMSTVPRYVAAIAVKDAMEKWLGPTEPLENATLRTLKKSIAAGVVGSVFTNPIDVLRNEVFKTDEGTGVALRRLMKTEGLWWTVRGFSKNIVTSAVPITVTIFLTDLFSKWRTEDNF
jgi:hypothetical protein